MFKPALSFSQRWYVLYRNIIDQNVWNFVYVILKYIILVYNADLFLLHRIWVLFYVYHYSFRFYRPRLHSRNTNETSLKIWKMFSFIVSFKLVLCKQQLWVDLSMLRQLLTWRCVCVCARALWCIHVCMNVLSVWVCMCAWIPRLPCGTYLWFSFREQKRVTGVLVSVIKETVNSFSSGLRCYLYFQVPFCKCVESCQFVGSFLSLRDFSRQTCIGQDFKHMLKASINQFTILCDLLVHRHLLLSSTLNLPEICPINTWGSVLCCFRSFKCHFMV